MEEKPEKKIIRETVKDRMTARHVLKRLALTGCLALVFGVVASLTFVLTRPWWEKEEPTQPTDPIVIFDDSTAAETPEPSSEAVSEPDEPSEPGSEISGIWSEIKPSVQAAVNDGLQQITEKDAYYGARRLVVQKVSSSIVNITVRSEEQSWLNQSVSSSGEYFGVIIAVAGDEVLLLAPSDVTTESGSVYASFGSVQLAAEVRGADREYGIAVLSVRLSDIPESFGEPVPVEFGVSSYTQQGFPVIALGAPAVRPGSSAYGLVTYIDPNVSASDYNIRIIQTDITAPDGSRGFLVNSAGEMIGWLTTGFSEYTVEGCAAAVSIADLKYSIETISNGGIPAKLGITGQTVTQAVAGSEGLPVGVYVTGREPAAAADMAGVLSGDVITAVDGEEIVTYSALGKLINSHQPGDQIALTVMRSNRGEWQKLILEAALGSR